MMTSCEDTPGQVSKELAQLPGRVFGKTAHRTLPLFSVACAFVRNARQRKPLTRAKGPIDSHFVEERARSNPLHAHSLVPFLITELQRGLEKGLTSCARTLPAAARRVTAPTRIRRLGPRLPLSRFFEFPFITP
jgi:hypothetical protein